MGNVVVRDRTIYGPDRFRYALSDDDMLWLARAVWGEAGGDTEGGKAVAWAMVQYHALVLGPGGRRPAFPTFTALLRAYCQPINPRWASHDAAGCRQNPERCTERHLARRRQVTNATWAEIPAGVQHIVEALADGALENPVPGMTDWAAYEWSRRSKVPLVTIGGNRFGVGRNRRLVS